MSIKLTEEDVRMQVINQLYAPIREIILATDAMRVAWDARDLNSCNRAMKTLRERVADYIEVVQQ
jgi:hypothetical protein